MLDYILQKQPPVVAQVKVSTSRNWIPAWLHLLKKHEIPAFVLCSSLRFAQRWKRGEMPGNHGMSLICVFRWQVQRHSGLKCRSTPGSGSSVTAGFGFVTIWTLLLLPMSPKSGSPLLTDFAFPYIPTNSLSVYLFSIKPTNWPLKEAWIFSPLTSTTKFLFFFFSTKQAFWFDFPFSFLPTPSSLPIWQISPWDHLWGFTLLAQITFFKESFLLPLFL